MRRVVVMLLASRAAAFLRAGPPRRLARAASAAADEQLEAVKVTIDQRLRDALRLPGKQRRPRCFVADKNEATLRNAIE